MSKTEECFSKRENIILSLEFRARKNVPRLKIQYNKQEISGENRNDTHTYLKHLKLTKLKACWIFNAKQSTAKTFLRKIAEVFKE